MKRFTKFAMSVRAFRPLTLTALTAIGCLITSAQVTAQVIYSAGASTNFGSNAANAGSGPTWTDSDSDGLYELGHAVDSGNNNAIFIDSSEGGTINDLTMTALGRNLTTSDSVVLTGSVAPSSDFYDSVANGFEMGIHSAVGFRANPNLIFQLRSTAQAGGTVAFFDYAGNTGVNSRNNAIPALVEASLNDGFSYTMTYTAADITIDVSDVELVSDSTVTSLSYTFTHGVDATSTGATTGFDFLTDVADGYAYYSQQKWSAGLPDQAMEIGAFQVSVAAVPEPTSSFLIFCSLAAVGFVRRRRSGAS